MKTYQFIITAALCSTLSFVAHGAIPISLPKLPWLPNIPSSLLQLCCSPDKRLKHAQAHLYKAAHAGDMSTVKQYLAIPTSNSGWQNGTFINPNYAYGPERHTPLMVASKMGHTEIVKLLIAAGANPQIETINYHSALSLAVRGGHFSTAQTLIRVMAAEKRKERVNSLLRQAIAGHHHRITKMLLAEDADINNQDGWGMTALMHAIARENISIIDALLSTAEIDVDLCERSTGDSPLTVACSLLKTPAIVELLLKADADVNHANHAGNTALDIALAKNKKDIVDLLLCYGAQPTDEQNRQLIQQQRNIITMRCQWIRDQFGNLEHTDNVPRDVSRLLIGTFLGLPETENLPRHGCQQ